jgi:hypothetical protein
MRQYNGSMQYVLTRWRILLAVLFFLIATAGAVYAFVLPQVHKTVVITRTADGFVPNKVFIDRGDTIVFKSTVGTQYWPASNFHPSHTMYPEFDPQRPIEPTEEWSFTFDRPGVWGFHDHLASSFDGTIVVRGTLGESTRACLATKGGSAALAPECWEADVKHLLDTKGIDATFAYIDGLLETDPAFTRNCHDVMHFVGITAYETFKDHDSITTKPETAICGYGFYHGFLEAMQKESGRGNIAKAKAYCEEVGQISGKPAQDPCIHGIGHALFDSIDGAHWGKPQEMINNALGVCETTFSTANDEQQCSTGIYNSFANAVIAKNYNLSFSIFDVSTLCSAQKSQYVQACYAEVANAYVRNKNLNREQSVAYIRSLPLQIQPNQFMVYFADEAKQNMAHFNAAEFAAGCMALRPNELWPCASGVVEGIREESAPTRAYQMQFPFCNALTNADVASTCIAQAVASSPKSGSGYHAACIAEPFVKDKSLCGTGE